jgi:copper chaperone CopZ
MSDYYMADTPGRLRIESAALKKSRTDMDRFQAYVKAVPGVTRVETILDIGSATIHYDTTVLDHTKLIALLDKSGYFDHAKAANPDDRLEKGIEGALNLAAEVVTDEVEGE